MRRGSGIAALDRRNQSRAQYTSLSHELNESKVDELRGQIDAFRRQLRAFAVAHKKDLRRDPHLRHAFQQMCTSMWVDPLAGRPATAAAGTRLGKVGELWNELLGFSDWQHELGVQVVDVCVSTRKRNGGVISMQDLIDGIVRLRRSSFGPTQTGDEEQVDAHITEEDVKRSIDALRPLGCGYEVFSLHGKTMVRTVPMELNADALSILQHLTSGTSRKDTQGLPFVTAEDAGNPAMPTLRGWSTLRAQQVLDGMVMSDGTMWVDVVPHDLSAAPESQRQHYYSPALVDSEAGHPTVTSTSQSMAMLQV